MPLARIWTRWVRSAGGGPTAVQPADDALLGAGGHRRHRVGLVVEGDVVEDVFGVGAVHAAQSVADDHGDLVGERRVVGAAVRDDGRPGLAVAVAVLEPFALQRRATGGGGEQEPAAAHVAQRPDEIAEPVEPEHRVEDEERDHRLAPGGVGGGRGDQRCHRARFADALLEDLAVGRFLVAEQQVGVDGFVSLPGRGVDLRLAEQGVDAEGAGLVGDDRHDPAADVGVAEQVAQQPGERGGGRRGDLVAGAGQQLAVGILSREDERARPDHSGRQPRRRAPAGGPSGTRTRRTRIPGGRTAAGRR